MNRLYARLGLHVRRGMSDRLGERRFPGRGQASGGEVEAWRPYTPGDDLRHLDWLAAARLDVLLTRRYVAEREVGFHFVVDRSASIGLPAGDRKREVADELVVALAWLALAARDSVRVTLLPGDGPPATSLVYRHRTSVRAVRAWLTHAPPAGALDLGAALVAHAGRVRRPEATVVVSDFMAEPSSLEAGVGALRERRHEVVLLQVLGPRELDPTGTHGELHDVESGRTHRISLTPGVRARYQELLAEHDAALRALAGRHDALWARLRTDTDVGSFLTGDLARLGLVRRR